MSIVGSIRYETTPEGKNVHLLPGFSDGRHTDYWSNGSACVSVYVENGVVSKEMWWDRDGNPTRVFCFKKGVVTSEHIYFN